jgi:DNA adenine methylase
MPRRPSTRYLSPLRYPGGKGRLGPFIGRLLEDQPRHPRRYVEPFAGGSGVGLRLLFGEYIEEIVLNDLNPGIAAFWRSVFLSSRDLVRMIWSVRPTVDEWRRQHAVYLSKDTDDVMLGFATFFLNRTNRSGILDARPIGGFDQSGKWGISARFNPEALASRIEMLARYSSRVTVCEQDGIDLISEFVNDEDTFVYADPPYLVRGDDLYLDTLRWRDHQRLAQILRTKEGWLLTYDADPRITEDLYAGLRCVEFQMSHTASTRRVGTEYAVLAPSLVVNTLDGLGSGYTKFVA